MQLPIGSTPQLAGRVSPQSLSQQYTKDCCMARGFVMPALEALTLTSAHWLRPGWLFWKQTPQGRILGPCRVQASLTQGRPDAARSVLAHFPVLLLLGRCRWGLHSAQRAYTQKLISRCTLPGPGPAWEAQVTLAQRSQGLCAELLTNCRSSRWRSDSAVVSHWDWSSSSGSWLPCGPASIM